MKTLNSSSTPSLPMRSQQGLSLIELMIALLLGTILTLGVTQVFLGSSQTYRTSDAVALLQENLRFSLSRISRDVRMAGYHGCMPTKPEDNVDTSSSRYNSELFSLDQGAIGWEAKDTGLGKKYTVASLEAGSSDWINGASYTLPNNIASKAIRGTDVLVLSGSKLTAMGPLSSPTIIESNSIKNGSLVIAVQDDCSRGERFENTGDDGSSTIAGATLTGYTADSKIYTYQATAYYIGVPIDSDEPALFQVALEPEGAYGNHRVELIRGVENMQVLYGIGSDKSVERYLPASDVTNLQWEEVVSVRIALLMRSDDRILDEDNDRTFNLIGTEIDPGADRRARLVGNLTVGIRNRLE